jgi:hypothetical protein
VVGGIHPSEQALADLYEMSWAKGGGARPPQCACASETFSGLLTLGWVLLPGMRSGAVWALVERAG